MEINKLLKFIVASAVLSAVNAVQASWMAIPPEQQLSDAHLVFTGEVSSTSWALNSERFVHIKVDKLLKNDLDGYPVKSGDKVKVILPDLKGYSTDFKFKNGDAGLWMLKYSNGALRASFPMVRSRMPEAKAAKILKDLQLQYKLALETSIPEQDKYLRRLLSIPAYPAEKALKKLNVPLNDDIDLPKVYVQSQYPESNYSVVMTPDGKVLSVIPFYSTGRCFKNGRLPVLQGHSIVFLNRKLKLLLPESEAKEKNPGKEYKAFPVSNGGWYFGKVVSGEVCHTVTPTLYIVVSAFSGSAHDAIDKKLLEITGEVVAISMKPGDVSNGVAIVKAAENSYKVFNGKGDIQNAFRLPDGYIIGSHWTPALIYDGLCPVTKDYKCGLINLKGEVVLSPVFGSIGNFTGGLAPFMKRDRSEFPHWGLMDKSGREIVKPCFTQFNCAQYDHVNGYSASVNVLSWVARGKIKSPGGKVKLAVSAMKYSLMPCAGVINGRGEWIIPPVFSHISGFENGLAEVFWRGRITTPNGPFRALINRRGKVVFVVKNIVKEGTGSSESI
jgi:hypothetical protein